MTNKVSFDQLLNIYRHTTFDANGTEGLLTIATAEVLADLQFIENDDRASEDANLAVQVEPSTLAVGQRVPIRVFAPRYGLGLLVRNLDALLQAPQARIAEPNAYYVIESGIERQTDPVPEEITRYRVVLDIVALFADAAVYLDRTKQELLFFRDTKVVLPIVYDVGSIMQVSLDGAGKLIEPFRDEVHKDQKLAILGEAIMQFSSSQPTPQRFGYLLHNIDALADEVRAGYRLFASSFSYAKIRSEIEGARVDYISRIHRTFVDIQGQLLGIPIAAIVVASQMEATDICGPEFWANLAVLAGAWTFLALLLIGIINQWITLSSIATDIDRQRQKLVTDYAPISDQFIGTFKGLKRRIWWHRGGLAIVGLIAVAGAIFASFIFTRLSTVNISTCVWLTESQTQLHWPALLTLV